MRTLRCRCAGDDVIGRWRPVCQLAPAAVAPSAKFNWSVHHRQISTTTYQRNILAESQNERSTSLKHPPPFPFTPSPTYSCKTAVQMRLPENDEGNEEGLVDLTQPLAIHSKRTERLRKRLEKKSQTKHAHQFKEFLDLPYDIMMAILRFLRPRDLFVLCCANKPLRSFILAEQDRISASVIALRYDILAKCLRRPVLMENIDPAAHVALLSPLRSEIQVMRKRPYQHVQLPDMSLVCTCLTCLLRWNSLCLVPDFAHWQDHLDKGEPIPTIPRGTNPPWNQELLARNADIAVKAMRSPLWYVRLLEVHLGSIARAIRRHGQNKGNQRRRFHMTEADARAGTDWFLEAQGPSTLDFPFNRDNYYMLEAFLPNRSWIAHLGRWGYLPADQHDKDVEVAVKWEAWRRSRVENISPFDDRRLNV